MNYYRNDFFNIYLRWFIIEVMVEGERIEVDVGETNKVTFINWRFNKGKEWRFFVEKDTLRRISLKTFTDNFLKIYNVKWEYKFREGRLSIVIKSSGRAQQ